MMCKDGMCKGGAMCIGHKIAGVLLVVGGLNWGLVGFFDMNPIDMYLPGVARVIYALVGISALMMLAMTKCCMKGGMCGCGAGCKGGACKGEGSCKGEGACKEGAAGSCKAGSCSAEK